MKISELHSMPDEFGKRAKELHTTKQRLMYGSEINTPVIAKATTKRERMNIADMLKFAVAGVAAAAVITMSPVQTEPEPPPVINEYDFGKYHYFVSYPTHRETLSPGGYALYLDVGTEEKKQAFYGFFADSVYELLRFFEENGEEYLNEDNSNDADNLIWTVYRSSTDDLIFVTVGRKYDFNDENLSFMNSLAVPSSFINYYNHDIIVWDEYGMNGTPIYTLENDFSAELMRKLNCFKFSDIMETYGGKSYEEVLETVSGLLDEFFLYGMKDGEVLQDDLLCYETIHSMCQFTVEQGTAELEMPEFISVMRDDELYGFKQITVPADKNYFLITGSDEYPLDKPYEFNLRSLIKRDKNDDIFINTMSDYTNMWESNWEFMGSYMSGYSYPMFYDEERRGSEYDVYLTDFIRRPRSGLTGTAPVYYGLTVLNVEEDTDVVVPQLCRPLPIEDTYYTFELPGNDTYTITNNGDHEVVAIGNYRLTETDLGVFGTLKRTGWIDQYFDYEPLMPGESLTIISSFGRASLTMPECCTVIDSSGTSYNSTGAEVDLLNLND